MLVGSCQAFMSKSLIQAVCLPNCDHYDNFNFNIVVLFVMWLTCWLLDAEIDGSNPGMLCP